MKKILYLLLLQLSYPSTYSQSIITPDVTISTMVTQVNKDSLQATVRTLVAFGTRNTLSTQTSSSRGIGAARKWVLQKFNTISAANNYRLTAYIDTVTLQPNGKRIDTTLLLGNVVALLRGTDTADKRLFVITAHLDNMRTNVMDRVNDAPGANDDASGCAAVLECARILSAYKFAPSILLITFSGEEQGLLGAYYQAAKAKKENWDIQAILNNDIMGSNNSSQTGIIDNTKLRVFSEGLPAYETEKNAKQIRSLGQENDGKARQLARYIKEVGERYVPNLEVKLVYRNDRFLRGGDHTAFAEQGYTAVRLTEMNENYTRQHQDVRMEAGVQYGDLEQYIDYEYLRKNTAINLSVIANLALAPAAPQQVTIDTKKLSNYTTLSWKPPVGKPTHGYYILIRETTSAFWERKIFTPNTTIELPYSKDNYYFALQAVNQAGNESLMVLPQVVR